MWTKQNILDSRKNYFDWLLTQQAPPVSVLLNNMVNQHGYQATLDVVYLMCEAFGKTTSENLDQRDLVQEYANTWNAVCDAAGGTTRQIKNALTAGQGSTKKFVQDTIFTPLFLQYHTTVDPINGHIVIHDMDNS